MAKIHLTSAERLQVYRLLFRMNRSFHLIVCRLDEAGNLGMYNPRELREMAGLTQEMQLEINTLLLERFQDVETGDHDRFGKVRIAMEKRLKG